MKNVWSVGLNQSWEHETRGFLFRVYRYKHDDSKSKHETNTKILNKHEIIENSIKQSFSTFFAKCHYSLAVSLERVKAGLSRPWFRNQIWFLGKIYLIPLCNAFWFRRVCYFAQYISYNTMPTCLPIFLNLFKFFKKFS